MRSDREAAAALPGELRWRRRQRGQRGGPGRTLHVVQAGHRGDGRGVGGRDGARLPRSAADDAGARRAARRQPRRPARHAAATRESGALQGF